MSLRRHYVLDCNIWYNIKILFTTLVLISNAISKTFWPWCAITIEKPFYSFTKQAVCQIIFWIPIIIKVKCVYEWMNEVKCVTISRPSHLQNITGIFKEFQRENWVVDQAEFFKITKKRLFTNDLVLLTDCKKELAWFYLICAWSWQIIKMPKVQTNHCCNTCWNFISL